MSVPRTIETAVLVIETAHKRRTTEQVACWYTEVELQPGEYEIRAAGPLDYFRSAAVDGTVTDEHFPGLWGGVPISGTILKPNVGKPTTFRFALPDSCEQGPDDGTGYGFNGRERFNAANKGKARIELREATIDIDVCDECGDTCREEATHTGTR